MSTNLTTRLVFDIETSPNAWQVGFKVIGGDEYLIVEDCDKDALKKLIWVIDNCECLVGFNSRDFDLPVLAAIMKSFSPFKVKQVADYIINNRAFPWQVYRKFGLLEPRVDHIDLMSVAPLNGSLKVYGARMHMPKLQDLPYHHSQIWDDQIRAETREYLHNDLDTTEALYLSLKGEVKLREDITRQYGTDVRSLSDTQVAGAIFKAKLGLTKTQARIPPYVRYEPPQYLEKIKHVKLSSLVKSIADTTYKINPKTGHVVMPEFLGKPQELFGGSYQLGVGGLHSKHDKKVTYRSTESVRYYEVDAASFYPSIIIRNQRYPASIGKKFIDEYRKIYETRLEAKRIGDSVTNESLKISLNGTFGLLGAKHSPLYSIEDMLYVTLTGQLTLLQLIEWTTWAGARCVSANTDGIVLEVKSDVEAQIREAVTRYEEETGYVFEWTPYEVIAFKDCNNYFAIKGDGKVKRKGIYAPPGLRKNANAPVVYDAVAEYLKSGVEPKITIAQAPVMSYLSARSVTGGGKQGDTYLGKVVRWYYTTRQLPPLTYASNGNKVPKTDGARACMEIKSYDVLPPDLDLTWYENEAYRTLKDIGYD